MAFLSGPRLLDWASSPPHLQFNKFVLTGYRPASSGSGCLRSLFYLHNELGNIYTHGEPRPTSCIPHPLPPCRSLSGTRRPRSAPAPRSRFVPSLVWPATVVTKLPLSRAALPASAFPARVGAARAGVGIRIGGWDCLIPLCPWGKKPSVRPLPNPSSLSTLPCHHRPGDGC